MCRLIPKGAKNIEVAKDFLKYFIQPQVNNEWLKTGLGRNIPCMPSVVKNDPWWFADPHRAAYAQQGLLYLPRLYVYHAMAPVGSDRSATFKVMERRLLRGIMNPAMIATWFFGLALAGTPGIVDWRMGFVFPNQILVHQLCVVLHHCKAGMPQHGLQMQDVHVAPQ